MGKRYTYIDIARRTKDWNQLDEEWQFVTLINTSILSQRIRVCNSRICAVYCATGVDGEQIVLSKHASNSKYN